MSEVLSREKFDRYITPEERGEFLQAFVARAIVVEPDEAIHACHDPRDNKFLELAVAAEAAYLITGDTDLLTLHPFRDIAIVTAGEFLAIE